MRTKKLSLMLMAAFLAFSVSMFSQAKKTTTQKKTTTTQSKTTTGKAQTAKPATTKPTNVATPKPVAKSVIAVGEKSGTGAKGEIIKSTDNGNTWKSVYQNFQASISGIAYGNGKWIAIGKGKALISASGEEDTWEESDISGVCPGSPRAIAFGAGFFLSVGEKGTFIYSKDGKKWTQINDVGGMQTSIAEYYNVKYANDKFIVVGNYNRIIIVIPQGDKVVIDKIIKNSEDPKECFSCIAVSTKIFVCGKLFFKSLDGKTFNQYTPNPAILLQGMGVGNGMIIGANVAGGLFHSADGVKWEIVPAIGNGSSVAPVFRDITFINNTFVGVGDKGNLWTSADGKNWKKITPADDFSANTFLSVGAN
jgi:photosystem II stability/assembly factor-like uncharacterized protein